MCELPSLELWKHWTDIVESLSISTAIIVGGGWTFYHFVWNRISFPRAEISHKIHHYHISNTKVLLHVEVKIENIGERMITSDNYRCWVQKVLPLDEYTTEEILGGGMLTQDEESEFAWPTAEGGEMILRENDQNIIEIEPTEFDTRNFEFILSGPLETVKVYSHIGNKKKKNQVGWDITTLYNINVTE